ncbi:endonuclease/exonuclease/phosphatase family protein [Luteimonas viscosa]|uniref:Endonuclease/exonuclease/phosphatase family protein n=1 Tax=Luteimonas viscosa TaxID=1132694 RepID=A0A5D4XL96_9GAMM|nr:endonuclease/exonuclease/phosphatase family protein [Luteimonas viscosa]TYT25468.1 endonuclease/exonuclease/phosphatase family protein [Luteimonas viscosa]
MTSRSRLVALIVVLALALAGCVRVNVHGDPSTPDAPMPETAPLRVATYNVSLYDEDTGGLIRRLELGNAQARRIAAVLQTLRPDIVLLNEFDYDEAGRAADLFQQRYLEQPQAGGGEPLRYPYRYLAPVNTGVPSGLDLDDSGSVGGDGRERGNDAWGYGLHPGQYGMLLLSKHPIDAARARTFRLLKWSAMPGARRPVDPATGAPFHRDEVWRQLRLSSKSHWDVPVDTPLGVLHVLASHPTPPTFDGPENRNGLRNHDEIRLWREYISPDAKPWLCDDAGTCGGLPGDARFVILGDLNNDPTDGAGEHEAIVELLEHPRVLRHATPRSEGAVLAAAADGGENGAHRGAHAHDTGRFGPRVGNLRLDYVLPSTGFTVADSGVFWPRPGDPAAELAAASDHHLVWIDLQR